ELVTDEPEPPFGRRARVGEVLGQDPGESLVRVGRPAITEDGPAVVARRHPRPGPVDDRPADRRPPAEASGPVEPRAALTPLHPETTQRVPKHDDFTTDQTR